MSKVLIRVFALVLGVAPMAMAQQVIVRVVGVSGAPIPYANVALDGGVTRMADPRGEASFNRSAVIKTRLTVRRMGYEPWYGTFTAADSSAVMTVELRRLSQRLAEVRVVDSATVPTVRMQGFYRRALDRQNGLGSGVFITPEEIDARNPNKLSQMLSGLNGVRLKQVAMGRYVPLGQGAMCQMRVLLDGYPIDMASPDQGGGIKMARSGTSDIGSAMAPALEDININVVAAIEVYDRSSGVPSELQPNSGLCGVIAVWTGARR